LLSPKHILISGFYCIHILETRKLHADQEARESGSVDFLLDIWGKTSPVLLCGGYKPNTALEAVDEKHKDRAISIVFGRHFTSNPDLVFRIREALPLTPYDRSLFYIPKAENGYTTWEFSKEWEAQATAVQA
jgi:NADPH2 dehydrogenase